MPETAIQESRPLNEISDFNQWLENGIEQLSDDFNKLVPKEIAYQYIDRLKKEGWLETGWDYLEALRAFRLYFILYELDNQLVKILKETKQSKSDIELRETWRHILRDFSKSTMELHKTLSDILEKAGLSKVANKGLADPSNNIITEMFNAIKNDGKNDTSEFDFEMKLHASKRMKKNEDPSQGSVFEDQKRELTEAEYAEIQEMADAG